LRTLRMGSRGSALALWQARHVSEGLREMHGVDTEIVVIKTSGDVFAQTAIEQIGGKGVFIKEIEDALLDRRVDLAVHSMKDVPTEIPEGLEFPAITKRQEARDCLLAREADSFTGLRRGAVVGTSSLRRQAQLRHQRPDIEVRELRGNVDTRVRKMEQGQYDAIVLAKAGLDRLGLTGKVTEIFATEMMLPAVGQGAMGIEARAEDRELLECLARLDDAETRAGVTAERALLAKLEGGCQMPLGAWGRVEDGGLLLDAGVFSADGTECLRRNAAGAPTDAQAIGRRLAEDLLKAGADRLLRLAGRLVG
jgi:hydroxymethylbilane synthase